MSSALDSDQKRIKAELGDILVQGWQESGCGDFVCRMELEFETSLDADVLRRALATLVDAEPILTSRLVTGIAEPYWEPGSRLGREVLCVTGDSAEYEQARDWPLSDGMQIEVVLYQEVAGDRLLIKVAHLISDGGSTTALTQRLARLYSALQAGEILPPARVGVPRRDLGQIFGQVPRRARLMIFLRLVRALFQFAKPTFVLPGAPAPADAWVRVLRRLEREQVSALSTYGRARQATLNDLFIAAYFRSLVSVGGWDARTQLAMPMTVDLRRWYLSEDAEVISNLAATEMLFLGNQLGSSFDETLAKVVAITSRQKGSYPGLMMMQLLLWNRPSKLAGTADVSGETKAWKRPGLPPVFTNFGPMERDSLAFGNSSPRVAYQWPSSLSWPGLVVGLSGYDGLLTLSARTAASGEATVAAILDGIISELPK